jgi:hypothetical protein
MIEKNPTKVASSFDEILLNTVEPLAKKPKKIVESMEDLVDLIQVTMEVKKKYKLSSSTNK